MSSRKAREMLRQRRIEFDKTVEENRRLAESAEPKPKKRGRPPKKKDDAQ